MTGKKSELICRTLASYNAGDVMLLDAQERPNVGGARRIALYFAAGTDAEKIILADGLRLVDAGAVGGAPLLLCETDDDGPIKIGMGGAWVEVHVAAPELEFLRGANAVVATRNGEDVQTVLDWIGYHATHFGMDGAVILNRAAAGQDNKFARKLECGLRDAVFQCRVVLLDSDVPFGHKDMPPEAHPFCVTEAPGKDRMEIPAPSPWDAPMGEVHLFEIARWRFLNAARAVANFDLHDLLMDPQKPSVFDTAVASEGGAIALMGQNCFPWRVRKNTVPSYADHVCVQFDKPKGATRWCVAPAKLPDAAVWKYLRVSNVTAQSREVARFFRFMGIRHPNEKVSKIVPKSSLIISDELVDLSRSVFEFKPIMPPEVKVEKTDVSQTTTAIVTTMKNEGPFILEWLAYHRVIGIERFLVYTNDCNDGTDTFLDLLQEKGIVQHRDNPFKKTGLKPQHAALKASEKEPILQEADWLICMDVDEYINVKVGDGSVRDLYAHVGEANMISCTWRLFGNGDVHEFCDGPIVAQFDRCAEEFSPKPHQAWGFKTLYRNIGIFKKMGVHRPKGLKPQLWEQINWVNGSGNPMPKHEYRSAWRSTAATYGYDLVALNHYAVRSAESFLVKRDRGRVNHVDRDQGLAYWFRMNNNSTQETSIMRMLPKLQAEMDRLLSDPEIAAAHRGCVEAHSMRIKELKASDQYKNFYAELTGPRMERLAQMHKYFGSNVFLAGPESVPDEVVEGEHPDDYFFTVEKQDATH